MNYKNGTGLYQSVVGRVADDASRLRSPTPPTHSREAND